MNDTKDGVSRYSDADLAEFKLNIETKLARAKQQLDSLEQQLKETTDSKSNEGDWMDDSSMAQDLDMLSYMASRQRKHIIDLENALIRIHNKNYGICMVTGTLIDKKRLIAVPTTSKSLQAKNSAKQKVKEPTNPKRTLKPIKAKQTIVTPIKQDQNVLKPLKEEDLMDDFSKDDLDLMDDLLKDDFDNIKEEDFYLD